MQLLSESGRHELLIQIDGAYRAERDGDLPSVVATLNMVRRRAIDNPEYGANNAVLLTIRVLECVVEQMTPNPSGF